MRELTKQYVQSQAGFIPKREYFAGLAMQGLLASDAEWGSNEETIARLAITQADKLLEELASTDSDEDE